MLGIELLRLVWNEHWQKAAIEQFDSGDAQTRQLAIEIVSRLARPRDRNVHEALILHLRDEDRLVRQAVYTAISRAGAEGAADVLVNVLQFDDGKSNEQRTVLVQAIDRLGKPGIVKLLALADSGDKKETDRVAEVYTMLRSPAAADGLPELLKNYHLSAEQKKALVACLRNYALDAKKLIGWLDARDRAFRLGVIREIAARRAKAALPRLERLARETADPLEAKVAHKAIDSLRAAK